MCTALTHTRTCAASLKFLKAHAQHSAVLPPHSCVRAVFVVDMSDILFNLPVESLPWPLASAMKKNGLAALQGTPGQESASGPRLVKMHRGSGPLGDAYASIYDDSIGVASGIGIGTGGGQRY